MSHFEYNLTWRDDIDSLKADVLDRILGEIRDDAQQIAPVDTGHLKESIHTEKGEDPDTGHVVADADYALWVEEGHRVAWRGTDGAVHYNGNIVPPQPYLAPALYRKR